MKEKVLTDKYLIDRGFESTTIGRNKFYKKGNVSLEHQLLGQGRFVFHYLCINNFMSKVIKTETDLEKLITFLSE